MGEKEETSFDQNRIEDDKKVSLEEMNTTVTSKRTLENSSALVSTEESVEKEGLSEKETVESFNTISLHQAYTSESSENTFDILGAIAGMQEKIMEKEEPAYDKKKVESDRIVSLDQA